MKSLRPETGGGQRPDVATPPSGSALNLSTPQAEALVRLAEDALLVWRRHQFFIWSQGPLHALLPHELLVCGAYLRQQRAVSYCAFQSVVLSATVLNLLTDGSSALMRMLAAAWVQGQGRAALLDSADLAGDALVQWQQLAQELGSAQLLVHGVARPQRPSEIESLFIFAGAAKGRSATERTRHAKLLMPYLHSTWRRVQVSEQAFNGGAADTEAAAPPLAAARPSTVRVLTAREREILLWAREGKSNLQIGEGLGISALTVKNHIQKILRKLGASNRAHAVALAMSQDLFAPADGSRR